MRASSNAKVQSPAPDEVLVRAAAAGVTGLPPALAQPLEDGLGGAGEVVLVDGVGRHLA